MGLDTNPRLTNLDAHLNAPLDRPNVAPKDAENLADDVVAARVIKIQTDISALRPFAEVVKDLEALMPKGKDVLDLDKIVIKRTPYSKLPYRVEFNTDNNHSVYFIGKNGRLYQHDHYHTLFVKNNNNQEISLDDTMQYRLAAEFPGEYYTNELFRDDQKPNSVDEGVVIFLPESGQDPDTARVFLQFSEVVIKEPKTTILESINLYKSKLDEFA